MKLGLVQGNPTIANLGDLAAARRSFERALSIAQSLVVADPSDHAARRTLALAHEKLSDADAWGGRLPQGVEHARSALEQWQSLATANPGSVSTLRAVATCHIKLGDLLGNPNLPSLSERAGATREYRHALALLRAVPRDSLSDWATRRRVVRRWPRLLLELRARGATSSTPCLARPEAHHLPATVTAGHAARPAQQPQQPEGEDEQPKQEGSPHGARLARAAPRARVRDGAPLSAG